MSKLSIRIGVCSVFLLSSIGLVQAEPIEAAKVDQSSPVDFSEQILPILRKNCLACHNKTDAESDLVLESPTEMLTGGAEGPSIIPGKSGESNLYKLAAHQEEPVMPPEDNDVGAKPLTPQELGLVKAWIDQGAKATATGPNKIQWQALPPGVNPVLSVSTTNDGRYVAAGRANQIFINHAKTGVSLGRLTDSSLIDGALYSNPGVAHLDMVQAIAFSPDNNWIASGGYRTLKLWKMDGATIAKTAGFGSVNALVDRNEHEIILASNGKLRIVNKVDGKVIRDLGDAPDTRFILRLDDDHIAVLSEKKALAWKVSSSKKLYQSTLASAVNDAIRLNATQIATAHSDNLIRVWNVSETGISEVTQLAGHTGPVRSLAGSAGGQIVSGSQDGTVRLWNIAEKKQVRQLGLGVPVTHVAIASDGSRIVAAGEDGAVRLWNASDGKQLAESKTAPAVELAAIRAKFASDVANRQANNAKSDLDNANNRKKQEDDNLKKSEEKHNTAAEDKKKKDEAFAKASMELKSAQDALKAIEDRIASAKTTVANAPEQIKRERVSYDAAFSHLVAVQSKYEMANQAFLAASQQLAMLRTQLDADPENAEKTSAVQQAQAVFDQARKQRDDADAARLAQLLSVNQAKSKLDESNANLKKAEEQIAKAKGETDAAKKAVDEKKKVADGAQKAVVDATRTLESAATSVELAKKAVERAQALVDETTQAKAAADQLAAQRQHEHQQAEKAKNEFRYTICEIIFLAGQPAFVIVEKSGRVVVLSSQDGSAINVIEPSDESQVAACEIGAEIQTVHTDGTLRTMRPMPSWSLARTIGSPDGESPFKDRVTAVTFDPTSQRIAVGGGQPSRDGELRIYNVADGSLVRDFPKAHSDTVFDVAFSPDGKHLASGAADRFMKVFSTETGELERTFEGHTHHVLSVSWQPDGRALATAGADKVVKLWNFKDGSQIRTIQGFGKEVTSLDHFGPNDEFVAVSGDKSIYKCNQGGARNGLGSAGDFLYTVSVSPMGNVVAYAGHDSVVRVIDTSGKSLANLKAQ